MLLLREITLLLGSALVVRHAIAGGSYLRTAAGAANQAAADVWESGTGGLEAIVTGDEQHQEGAWFGPEALLPYRVIDENDKRAAVEYDVEADSRIHPGSTSPACQWHVKFAFNYTSQGLIEPQASYFAEIITGASAGIAYKIKGRFPPALYFSWQVYNSLFVGEAAKGITDFEIKPHWGKNPVVDATATPETSGGYELYLTPTGEEGYDNELPLPRGITNTLILRTFKPDPVVMGEFGRVEDIEPPVLYVGNNMADGSRQWQALPPCSAAQKRRIGNLATGFYNVNYPQATGTLGRGVVLQDFNCPLSPERGNTSMVLFEGAWLPTQVQNLVARQSSDSPYLFYCINPNNDYRKYWNSLIKIRFKLPSFPYSLFAPTKVANKEMYDMRFFSIATADSVLPQPTIASLDGAAIKRKYNNTQGSGWDGWVEIRIAVSEEKARACNFWDDNAIFLPLYSERVEPAKSITIIIRSVLGYGSQTAGAASRACAGGVECGDAAFIRNIMGDYYPELEIFNCDSCADRPPIITQYQDYHGRS
ncbi:Hypothetical protein NocV09_02200650 [Nannochloropsis oceanica]